MNTIALSAPPMLPVAESSLPDTILLVTFSMEHQWYGLPLASVLQVIRLPALLTLAGAPPILCGMLNLHGQYLPVLSGRSLVNLPQEYAVNNQILIVGHMQSPGVPCFGLLVDQVHDVYTSHRTQFTPLARHTAAAFLRGVFQIQERSVLLCDVQELLALIPGEHQACDPNNARATL